MTVLLIPITIEQWPDTVEGMQIEFHVKGPTMWKEKVRIHHIKFLPAKIHAAIFYWITVPIYNLRLPLDRTRNAKAFHPVVFGMILCEICLCRFYLKNNDSCT